MQKIVYLNDDYIFLLKDKKINFSKWVRAKLDEEFGNNKKFLAKKLNELDEQIELLKKEKQKIIGNLQNEN